MTANKTQPTKKSPTAFLNAIEDKEKRKDAKTILKMMKEVTGKKPVMWGESIIGFGTYHYKYESGREGDFLATGFSPRKQNFSIYIMPGFSGREGLLKKLGPHKTGSSCLYIKRLKDIDLSVLRQLVDTSFKEMKKRYGAI